MKRLVLLFDGTWNDVEDNTNVRRMYAMIAERDGAIEQRSYYDAGVGTGTFDHIRGGAVGTALGENVREAYGWLSENYAEDPAPGGRADEVYILGFSRGAFTARSLAGMIARCGLIRPGAPLGLLQVFERYRREKRALHEILFVGPRDLEEEWLAKHSRRVRITFIGVWETVGALGVPFGGIPCFSRPRFQFLDTSLGKSNDHAYQALAIDENRKDYDATLWSRFTPKDAVPAPAYEREQPQTVEQRWFVGAHANVGGGYKGDPLAQVPLSWIRAKAAAVGLKFREDMHLIGNEFRAAIVDSFSRFAFGLYRLARLGKRHWRPVARPLAEGTAREDGTMGSVATINETLDASVIRRWQTDSSYRPENLIAWSRALGKDIAGLQPGPDGGYRLERQHR